MLGLYCAVGQPADSISGDTVPKQMIGPSSASDDTLLKQPVGDISGHD